MLKMASKDYYKILEVSKDSSKEDIKKAYKKLAKKYHPDISQETDAEIKFKEINEAAGVLLDDQKRQQYDTYGTADGPQGFGGFGGGGFNPEDFGINIDDIFEQFGFGGFSGFGGGGRGHSRTQRRADTRVYAETEIDLKEVYFGTEKEISISRDDICDECRGLGTKNKKDVQTCDECGGQGFVVQTQRTILGMMRTQKVCPKCHGEGSTIKNPCEKCNGSGTIKKKEKVTIKIPKGVSSGTMLRIQGKGSYDPQSETYGDLYVKIFVNENKIFNVEGEDLYMTLDVNFIQAIVGDEVEIEHFEKDLLLKIPAGTQPGTVLRLKNKGMPYLNYNSYGDLYVKVNVEIPTKITKEQKKILGDYAKTLKDKNFFSRIKGFFS